jgi:hypothetical protein
MTYMVRDAGAEATAVAGAGNVAAIAWQPFGCWPKRGGLRWVKAFAAIAAAQGRARRRQVIAAGCRNGDRREVPAVGS